MLRINIEVTEGNHLRQIHEIQVINRGPVGGDLDQYQINFDGSILAGLDVLHKRADGVLVLAGLAIQEVLSG